MKRKPIKGMEAKEYYRKYINENRDKKSRWDKKYREKNPDKMKQNNKKYYKDQREYRLKRDFNLTIKEYNLLMDVQNGRCAVCGNKQESKRLAVDHNHTTGKVRGLLCNNCNVALGYLKEDVERIENLIAYIKKHNQI